MFVDYCFHQLFVCVPLRFVIGPQDTLKVASIRPDDAGMYQCFAHNDWYSSQDSAQLRLGCKC
jgi:hypothetical protein